MNSNRLAPAAYWLTCSILLGILGCGPSQGNLTGAVSYKGKPLALGGVRIIGGDGVAKSGTINDDGTYEIQGVGTGTIKIAITSPNPATQVYGIRKKNEPPPPPKANPKWFPIPEKYGDFDTSGLTFTLKRGKNTHDITLD